MASLNNVLLILQSKVIAITLFVCLSVYLFSVCPLCYSTQYMGHYTEHLLQSLCLSVYLFICLSVFCVSAMLLNTIHGTLHGTLWCYIMKRSCIFFWGKAGVCWGELRWGRVWPNKPIVPIFNHFEPHKTTFSRTKPLLAT